VCVPSSIAQLLFVQIMEETACSELSKPGVKRPMNAFLIFCKRQRSHVREKNPHVDNRSVTRILGDLWANLDVDEKSTYTNLAKQVIFTLVLCVLYNTIQFKIDYSVRNDIVTARALREWKCYGKQRRKK